MPGHSFADDVPFEAWTPMLDLDQVNLNLHWNPFPRRRDITPHYHDYSSDDEGQAPRYTQDDLLRKARTAAEMSAHMLVEYRQGRILLDAEEPGDYADDYRYWRGRARVYQIEQERLSRDYRYRTSGSLTPFMRPVNPKASELEQARISAENIAGDIEVLPGGKALLAAHSDILNGSEDAQYWREKERVWGPILDELRRKTELERARYGAERDAHELSTYPEGQAILDAEQPGTDTSEPAYWYGKRKYYEREGSRLSKEFWEEWKRRVLNGENRRSIALSVWQAEREHHTAIVHDLVADEEALSEGSESGPSPEFSASIHRSATHVNEDGASGLPRPYDVPTTTGKRKREPLATHSEKGTKQRGQPARSAPEHLTALLPLPSSIEQSGPSLAAADLLSVNLDPSAASDKAIRQTRAAKTENATAKDQKSVGTSSSLPRRSTRSRTAPARSYPSPPFSGSSAASPPTLPGQAQHRRDHKKDLRRQRQTTPQQHPKNGPTSLIPHPTVVDSGPSVPFLGPADFASSPPPPPSADEQAAQPQRLKRTVRRRSRRRDPRGQGPSSVASQGLLGPPNADPTPPSSKHPNSIQSQSTHSKSEQARQKRKHKITVRRQ